MTEFKSVQRWDYMGFWNTYISCPISRKPSSKNDTNTDALSKTEINKFEKIATMYSYGIVSHPKAP